MDHPISIDKNTRIRELAILPRLALISQAEAVPVLEYAMRPSASGIIAPRHAQRRPRRSPERGFAIVEDGLGRAGIFFVLLFGACALTRGMIGLGVGGRIILQIIIQPVPPSYCVQSAGVIIHDHHASILQRRGSKPGVWIRQRCCNWRSEVNPVF